MHKITLAGIVAFIALVGAGTPASAQGVPQNYDRVQPTFPMPQFGGGGDMARQYNQENEMRRLEQEQQQRAQRAQEEQQQQLNNFQLQLQRSGFPQPIFK